MPKSLIQSNRFLNRMIRSKKKIGVIIIFLLAFCSCTTETIEQVPVLKKMVEISIDGTSTTTTFAYNGTKIIHIDKPDALSEFYYTGDLITKMVEFTKSNSHKNIFDYSYSNGELVKMISSDNYVVNYVHNTDGSVSYEKLTRDSKGLDVKIYHGILYFQKGNLIKDEKTFDDTGNSVLSQSEVSFVYDSKHNPLLTIQGFDKLLCFQQAISLNNCISWIESYIIKNTNDDQIISSAKRYDSQYQYDSNGYPTEIVSEKNIFGSTDSKHLKSQFFYN